MTNMLLPLQITLRNIENSETIHDAIHKGAENLSQLYPRMNRCKVTVSKQEHSGKGKKYDVCVEVFVPGRELVCSKDHRDFHVALRDAFLGLERQLKDYAQRRRGERVSRRKENKPVKAERREEEDTSSKGEDRRYTSHTSRLFLYGTDDDFLEGDDERDIGSVVPGYAGYRKAS